MSKFNVGDKVRENASNVFAANKDVATVRYGPFGYFEDEKRTYLIEFAGGRCALSVEKNLKKVETFEKFSNVYGEGAVGGTYTSLERAKEVSATSRRRKAIIRVFDDGDGLDVGIVERFE